MSKDSKGMLIYIIFQGYTVYTSWHKNRILNIWFDKSVLEKDLQLVYFSSSTIKELVGGVNTENHYHWQLNVFLSTNKIPRETASDSITKSLVT